MEFPQFKIEEFWKEHEFSAPYLLCCSDAESWTLNEIIEMADSETKKLWDTLRLGYTEPQGNPLLRNEILKLYSSIDSSHILTFAGAEEGIYCTIRALVNPGDHVVIVKPCYQSLETIPELCGAEITSVELDPARNWRLDIGQLERAFRSDTKLLIINYPHNPTGALLSKEELSVLIEVARRRGAYILCDEVYRYLEIEESKRLPSIVDSYEKGITLNVMTKSFGLAGLRIGWIATHDKVLLENVSSYKMYTSICNSALSETVAIIALRAKDVILKRNRKILLSNLSILDSFMERYKTQLRWTRPSGGTMALIELLLPIPIETFYKRLVQEKGVLIMPGNVLGIDGNFFRIGFGRRNMPEILQQFEQFLLEYS